MTGAQFKLWLEKREMTQLDFAEFVDLGERTVRRYVAAEKLPLWFVFLLKGVEVS